MHRNWLGWRRFSFHLSFGLQTWFFGLAAENSKNFNELEN